MEPIVFSKYDSSTWPETNDCFIFVKKHGKWRFTKVHVFINETKKSYCEGYLFGIQSAYSRDILQDGNLYYPCDEVGRISCEFKPPINMPVLASGGDDFPDCPLVVKWDGEFWKLAGFEDGRQISIYTDEDCVYTDFILETLQPQFWQFLPGGGSEQ